MKKLLLALLVLTTFGLQVKAQQDARYTKFIFNKLVYNPAYAGSSDGLNATLLTRSQWGFITPDIPGAPRGGTLSVHTPLGQAKKIGVGGWLEYDQIGVHDRISASADYSYSFILGESRLSLGIQAGVLYMRTNFDKLEGNEALNPLIDPAFIGMTGIESKLMPNFGLGLYYYKPNKFYVGASVPHLIDNTYGPTKLAHQYRHYNFMGGLVFPLGESLKIKPSALVKLVPKNAPVQVDANLMFLIKDAFWIGATYRAAINNFSMVESESIDGIIAFQVKGIRIGYAYDYTLSSLNLYNNGSHELMLGYDIGGGKGPRIRTPRYF